MNKKQTIRRKKARHWKNMKKTINIELLRRKFCSLGGC
jgi:hypothetical protein